MLSQLAFSQNIAGYWEGIVEVDGIEGLFNYELKLYQDNQSISGTACSSNDEMEACFILSGRWDGDLLILQEVEQTSPSEPQWCLKYAQLKLSNKEGQLSLNGTWTAKGCNGGNMSLQLTSAASESYIIEEQAFSPQGEWIGQLSQSDRDYGFFFKMDLSPNTGTSYIESDGPGGNAFHELEWNFDGDKLIFNETKVVKKSIEDWKWCIKSAQLKLRKEAHAYFLEGNWEGYIEHKSPENGACAPGYIRLQKPILNDTTIVQVKENTELYEENGRKVKIGQSIVVKSDKLKIRVWDNGTVDGDIVTLFLNGNRLLKNYRVSKKKRTLNVKLKKGETNIIILQADDLGDITPNTVAVSVYDGVEEQIIIVSSNLEYSSAILIKEFEYE